MEESRVLITTSGLGSRLGDLTDFTNKSLVRVGDKPAISHIIDSYNSNTHFVVTIGHYGNHVREFLELAYPSFNFTFVDVKNYKGTNSSLLHSMREAKQSLQCPFIFHVCDSVILDEIPLPSSNWIAGAKSKISEQYRTFNISHDGKILKINEKGEINYDFAYPGLVGIKDFKLFWKYLDSIIDEASSDDTHNLSDCHVLQKMIDTAGIQFDIVKIDKWHDIGEPFALSETRKQIKSSIEVLDKVQENIYIVDGHVIKFFHNSDLVAKRVERSHSLSSLIPEIQSYSNCFFKYKFVPGQSFSDSVTPRKMKEFLHWISENMWLKNKTSEDISKDCKRFYFEKTRNRIFEFLGNSSDTETIINNEIIPPVDEMLSLIDEKWLCDGIPSTIHGDLILDNVIDQGDKFVLIDWRQDFANRLDVGDIYYDLAKLNHNLIFNHELVNQGQYTLSQNNGGVDCDILCRKNLIDCRDIFHKFIEDSGYDLKKVNLLTSLIWINMSPLHEHPIDKFLFNFGKYNLFHCLKIMECIR